MIFFFQIFYHHRRHTFCIFPRKQISILTSINLYSLVALGLPSSASHFFLFFLIHFTLHSTHKHTIHSIYFLQQISADVCVIIKMHNPNFPVLYSTNFCTHSTQTKKNVRYRYKNKKYTNNRMFTYERRRDRRTHTFKYYIFCVRNVG